MTAVDFAGYLFGVIAVILLILPPKYDPAIRGKEWREIWKDRR
jgi:hypothetical protein